MHKLPIKIIHVALLLFVTLNTACAEKPIYYVYLAGPEVFLPEPVKAGKAKQLRIEQLNEQHDWPFKLVGLYPLDNEIPDFKPDFDTGIRIYHANIALMEKAHAVTANMVRFRGPSMDVGTAFEMGYMAAQDKPVIAYYDAKPFYGKPEKATVYATRVTELWGDHPHEKEKDKDGIFIENFGMTDNLMMVGAHTDSGFTIAEDFDRAIMNVATFFLERSKQD